MTRKFLATTALDEFWDKSQPILFLGDWCIKDEEKLEHQKIQGEFLSGDLTGASCSKEAYDCTTHIYECLLPKISQWLNDVHQKAHSLKYWKVIVGPFLLWYIQVVYHRFVHLKAAFQLYPDIKTIGLMSHSFLTPVNTAEFYFFASESDAWNLQLITQILECSFKAPSSYLPHHWSAELIHRQKKLLSGVKYKNSTQLKLNLLKYFLKIWPFRKIGFACCADAFSKKNFLKLMVKSGFRIFPIIEMQTRNLDLEKKYDINFQLREGLNDLLSGDKFIALILKTLVVNMPLNFIEHYDQELNRSKQHFPYKIDTVISTTWMQHDLLKMWGASQAERSAKLVNMQHGGGYGMVNYCAYELLERKNCDAFISWGWAECKEIFPAPSILACERFFAKRKNKSSKKTASQALWIANEMVRYIPYISSYFQSPRSYYLEWQSRFFHSLSKNTALQVVMRLQPTSKKAEIIKKYMPNLTIYIPTEKESFFNQLSEAKILLCDTLNTTFLYAFVFNIPILIFASRKFWEVRNEVFSDFFSELRRLNIYHDTPESAADWLNKHYDNIGKIWRTKEIQLIREKFVDRFVRVNENWVVEWKNLLLNL